MLKFSLLCIIGIGFASASNLINLVETAKVPNSTKELILVKSKSKNMASVTAWEKNGKGWQQVLPAMDADVGSQGITQDKHEGDNKTPEGLFALGPAFGTELLALKMDYRYVTSVDKFVDDVNSSDYNHWIHGNTTAQSYEQMKREDGIYRLGVVVNYNMHPVIKGKGSAIFMHIWYGPNIGTTGCIALDEKNMLKLLRWLNKDYHPYILITN